MHLDPLVILCGNASLNSVTFKKMIFIAHPLTEGQGGEKWRCFFERDRDRNGYIRKHKKEISKNRGKGKADIMHFIEDADVPDLLNVKLALLDLYNGRNRIEEEEFMADDVDSCEADRMSSL